MPNLSFQYPTWFLLFCVLLGLGYAGLLYYRDTTFREQSPWLRRVLFLLRALSITLLSALLLSPLLRRVITETQKPVVVLAQDQSESIASALSNDQLTPYQQQWQVLRDALKEDFDVRELAFGDQVREGVNFQFTDKVTNLSEVVREVYDRYGAQNLGAIVLATDGIFNEGSNPAYTDAQLTAPVFSIALGDTTPKRDLMLKRVFHNNIAYLGDQFTFQIDVAASNCGGAASVLTIGKREGDQVKPLQSIPVNIIGNDFFTTKEVVLKADQPGVSQYVISVAKVPNEASATNNVREVFIDVLDARQKILLLANGPHPDISALRQMLELNKNYAVSVANIGEPGVQVADFDFVVLHNLPSRSNDISGLLNTLNEKRIPRLFIAGMLTNFTALNQAQSLITAQSDGQQNDDAQGIVAPKFAAFNLSPRLVEELPKFNPLITPFGNFAPGTAAQVILYQRIGKVNTDRPLLAVGEANGIKTGIFVGEGLWKWKLFDYLQHQNHDIFDELVGKTVQYLSLKEDKRKFRVTLAQTLFNENEAVQMGAELYNDNYELTNDPDVAVVIRHQDGREFPFTFNKSGRAYALNAGILPTGNYTYRAYTTFNGQQYNFEGRFSVRPLQLELFATTANHAVLRQLAQQYGGDVVAPADMVSIAEQIKTSKTIKPLLYETATTNPLINLKWIFALLAGLLALEWLLRRYFGAY
jgi:hypothetical protein